MVILKNNFLFQLVFFLPSSRNGLVTANVYDEVTGDLVNSFNTFVESKWEDVDSIWNNIEYVWTESSIDLLDGDYVKLEAVFNLKNEHTYDFIVELDNEIVYIDKIFCTDQTVDQQTNQYYSIDKDRYIMYSNDVDEIQYTGETKTYVSYVSTKDIIIYE